MEIIQKLVLETLEKDSIISDTRVLNSVASAGCDGVVEFGQQQVLGVLMRLESHQVRTRGEKRIENNNLITSNSSILSLDDRVQGY